MNQQTIHQPPLLDVRSLSVGFVKEEGGPQSMALAVDNVSFTLERGKILCLVGESGCGKSVTALAVTGLLPSPPAVIAGGEALFEGRDVLRLPGKELQNLRGAHIGMIFQDPVQSLNPVMRVGEQITEGLRRHKHLSASQARESAVSLLRQVGIPEPGERILDFPHQLSGGMCQRVMIAMALSCKPSLIIADEPTTALDVTIQRQILALMKKLVQESGSGLLLITHDLGVVARIATDVAVMYAGTIVEQGVPEQLLNAPLHPYGQGLMRSRPGLPGTARRLEAIAGSVPPLWARPRGCAFHPRCPHAFARCAQETPPLFLMPENRRSRCWLQEKEAIGKSEREE